MSNMSTSTLGFIGAGNMASSLIDGLIRQGHAPQSIIASTRHATTQDALHKRFHILATRDNHAVASAADMVVLAVKPQMLKAVLLDIAPTLHIHKPLIISVAAGISLNSIETWLGGTLPIVRCMPNTPAQVLMGASGLYANAHVSAAQRVQTQAILEAVGLAVWLDTEAQIDAVTAVSGSGPAYFFLLMEAMIATGIELGLAPETARALTLQTARGAAQMAVQADVDPATLRARVTSPGGTTASAIAYFDSHKLRETISGAVQAAAARSKELTETLT